MLSPFWFSLGLYDNMASSIQGTRSRAILFDNPPQEFEGVQG